MYLLNKLIETHLELSQTIRPEELLVVGRLVPQVEVAALLSRVPAHLRIYIELISREF